MIAVTSRGASFRALASYLVAGRTGTETERVAWTSARNLVTDDPALAAKLMRATAAENVRAERPVYHLAVSFDAGDRVDRATMERVVDRVLDRLGLTEHQAVLVAHRDREHAHVHVLVNRVHPETLRVNALSFDYRAIESVLRAEEQVLGLRVVPGKHAARADELRRERGDTRGHDRLSDDAIEVRTGGVERIRRRGEMPFLDRVRAASPALRAAESWGTLYDTLAARGWWMERKGQGLVIVGRAPSASGDRCEVRASRVHRDLSLASLEARFDAPFVDRVQQTNHVIAGHGGRLDALTDGTRARAGRTADAPLFRVMVRERLHDVRASRSWDELASRLVPHGLQVTRGRHGLAITDGIARCPISRLGADTTPTTLEARFRQSFGDWVRSRQRADLGLTAPGPSGARDIERAGASAAPHVRIEQTRERLSLSARSLGRRVEQYDRRRRLEALVFRVGDDADRVRAGHQLLEGRVETVVRLEQRVRAGFAAVYRHPSVALTTFRAMAEGSGVAYATATLRDVPERFGVLHGSPGKDEARGLLGRLFRAGEGATVALATARQAATGVARLTEEWAEARRRMPAAGEVERLAAWETRLAEREQTLRRQLTNVPPRSQLERAIAGILPRVGDRDMERLAGTLRGEQRVILETFREARAEVARTDRVTIAGALRQQLDIDRTPRAPGDRPTAREHARERANHGDLAARVATLVLRQMRPAELRAALLAMEALRSPASALRHAVGHALKQQLLGRDGAEH